MWLMFKIRPVVVFAVFPVAMLLVASCDRESGFGVPPAFGILSDSEMHVSSGEVSVSVEYSLENPAKGGKVTGSSTADWISGYTDIADSSKVRFIVGANPDTADRTAMAVFSYIYDGGSISDTVIVIQSGESEGHGTGNDPFFALVCEDGISVSRGESEVLVEYVLENAVEGGRIAGSSPAEWIGDYTVEENMRCAGFTVKANPDTAARSAEVVFSYVYGDGRISDTVTVNQSGKSDDYDPDAPEIVFLTGMQYDVPDEESDLSVRYFIIDAVDGARMKASTGAYWIGGFEYYPDSSRVDFTVSANTAQEERTAEVMFTYRYEKDGHEYSVSKSIRVVQGRFIPAEVDFEAAYFSGHYLGDVFGHNGETNYMINLSDKPVYNGMLLPGGTYYTFDIFSTEPENADAISVPEGTYVLGQAYQTELMTLNPEYTYWCRITPDGSGYEIPYTRYDSGTLTISKEGDGYLYYAELVDNNGTVHKLTYKGDAIIDNTERYSSLFEDRELDCDGMRGQVDLLNGIIM